MPRTINQRELRNDSGEIMRAVESGETFVVTRNGVPVAELRPLRRRSAVPSSQLLAAIPGLAHVDAALLRTDVDQVLDQDAV